MSGALQPLDIEAAVGQRVRRNGANHASAPGHFILNGLPIRLRWLKRSAEAPLHEVLDNPFALLIDIKGLCLETLRCFRAQKGIP